MPGNLSGSLQRRHTGSDFATPYGRKATLSSASHKAREATRCDRTNHSATKRNGSYKVAVSLTYRADLSSASLRKGIGGIGATDSRTKTTYAVESHYLLGVEVTGNPLRSEIW